MAQSDQAIQNALFPSVRTDLNDNLAAIFSQSSGPSAPAVTVAFQPWVDTSSNPPVWKIRNAANNGWITVGLLGTNFAVGGTTPIANGGTGETTAVAALAALLPSQTGQAGKALTTDGTTAGWGNVGAGATMQVLTSSGFYTPTSGKTSFLVIVTGGGGAGSGIATGSGKRAGGGAGATSFRVYSSTEMGSSASITVGAGGTGTTGAGNSGGNSVFTPSGSGTAMTANGGTGGSGATTGGSGGTATGGQINLTGGFGVIDGYAILRTPGSGSNDGGPTNGYPGGTSFWGYNFGRGGYGAGTSLSVPSPISGEAGVAGVIAVLEW